MGLGGEGGEEGLAVDSGVLVDCDEVVVVVEDIGGGEGEEAGV